MSLELHYTEVKDKDWHWKNFTPKELACKSTGLILIDEHALDCLQRFRDLVRGPVIVDSAYRSLAHNTKVGGAPRSKHMLGQAFDIRITPFLSRAKIKELAKKAGFLGFGDYNTFVHIDIGPSRTWDLRK